ncbi:MAG: lecithin retinol acyltransferase family protein [Streptosporangiaceae bacterium]
MYGDMHVVGRKALGLVPYRHFGIEMPGGDICENSLPGIRVVPFADFARGGPTVVRNPGASPAERAQAVQRAGSRIGEHRYSLTGNNCEHFANWCATGMAISHQVLEFLAMLAQLARLVFTAAAAVLAITVIRAATAE